MLGPRASALDALEVVRNDRSMGSGSSVEQRVQDLHNVAVKRLIEAHQNLDERLLLAIRYDPDDSVDIGLLEVLAKFPGGDDDELFVTEYEPSPNLRILGKLHLTLGSPGQLRSALDRGEALISKVKRGTVEFVDKSSEDASQLLEDLGLQK